MKNSKNMSPEQNVVYKKIMYIKYFMDSGIRESNFHKFHVNKINILTKKILAKHWSTMAWLFSTTCKAKIKLKMSELNVNAHISLPFCITTKKGNYDENLSNHLVW